MTTSNGETPDIANNIAALRQLFPEVICEDKVDFDKLRQLLGEYVDDDKERYNFTWNGKGKALRLSQMPSTGTLRPCRAESKDWETTGNLYIEGDNLEVLKLLQKSYHSRVKMIYIDPPYNTGNDFIYPDDFFDSIESPKKITGQIDGNGNKISSNTEQPAVYHTNWLSMMYPRLRLARNIMTDDGVIFISIDDHELANLTKVCNEIFGEENFIGIFCRKTKSGGGSASDTCAVEHDYVVSYAKLLGDIDPLLQEFSDKYLKRYKEKDKDGYYFWDTMERSSTETHPYTIIAPDGTTLKGKWFRNKNFQIRFVFRRCKVPKKNQWLERTV